MTNEELEKELEETKKELAETQKALLTLAGMVGRTRAVLRKIHNVIDDLDISYIKGELTEEEYIKKYKEQNSLANAFNMLFNMPTTDDKKEEDNNDK